MTEEQRSAKLDAQKRYDQTPKGKATRLRYYASPKGKLNKRKQDLRYYQKHKEEMVARQRRKDLRQRYGLSEEEYQVLYNKQGGVCASCHEPETLINQYTGEVQRLSVDHDHETKRVRGLACARCNRFVIPVVEKYLNYVKLAEEYLR